MLGKMGNTEPYVPGKKSYPRVYLDSRVVDYLELMRKRIIDKNPTKTFTIGEVSYNQLIFLLTEHDKKYREILRKIKLEQQAKQNDQNQM